jgi:hypothetical protein
MDPARSGVVPYWRAHSKLTCFHSCFLCLFLSCLLNLLTLVTITSRNRELYNMSSTDIPPDYYGTTTVSEKADIVSEEAVEAATYHITLQRCKRMIKTASGRDGVHGFIEERDFAITILPEYGYREIREKISVLFQKAWPVHLANANSNDFGMSINAQYSTQNGDIYGCIGLLAGCDDGIWVFLKRDDIQILNLVASSAPYGHDATGDIDYSPRKPLVKGLELSGKSRPRGVKRKIMGCVLQ